MNDETGFRQFVNARWPALVQSAYLVTLDRGVAEDCVQEALTRVHRRWRRVAVDHPEAYVRKAVLNSALSWRRKRRLHEVGASADVGSGDMKIVPAGPDPDAVMAAMRATGQEKTYGVVLARRTPWARP